MPKNERILAYHDELTAIRRDIHKHPETAFEEERTAAIVAERLAAWGIEVHRGLAKTGVVGTLRCGASQRAVGLRADMDALKLDELNDVPYRSVHEGKMHACGHDGHTAMLLGAARYLAETRTFDGTVHFVFQPAEELDGGGKVMIEDGLFERFPVDAIYGMHNMPGLPAGQFAVVPGAVLASADTFGITISGVGGHGAWPHECTDPVLIAGEIILALQSIVSRGTDPLLSAVVSVTQMRAGDAANVIPETAELAGTARAFSSKVRDAIEASMRRITEGVCAAHGATGAVAYERGYPPTVNHPEESEIAAAAAARVVGGDNVVRELAPMMGSEDFSYMLEARPGCYIFIGNGVGDDVAICHSPRYDFNDDILPIGAEYWVSLVESALAKG